MARPTLSPESIASRREEILKAAMQVLEANGSTSAVTLRAVAKVLNWSYSTTYRYYKSKEELLVALRTLAFRWMQEELDNAVAGAGSEIEGIERLTHAFINAGLRRPDLYQLMFFELTPAEATELQGELEIAKRDCLDVCTQAIVRAQAAGELNASADPLTTAHVFWVSAHGTVSLQLANQLIMGRDLQEVIHSMINTVFSGLQTPGECSEYFLRHSPAEQPTAKVEATQ
ncbi:MAG: TetR/AcrR family transcriptional regulator [Pseudomonadota bacterium]